jgi:urea transport system permease protein
MEIRFKLIGAWLGLALMSVPVSADTNSNVAEEVFVQASLMTLSASDNEGRRATLIDLARTGDPRMVAVFEAFRVESLYVWKGQVVRCDSFSKAADGSESAALIDPLTTDPVLKDLRPLIVPASELTLIAAARADRKLAQTAGQLLKLNSPDSVERQAGVKKCGDSPVIVEATPILEDIAKSDPDRHIRELAKESLLLIQFDQTSDPEKRLSIVKALGDQHSLRSLTRLQEASKMIAASAAGAELALGRAYKLSIRQIEGHQRFVDRAGGFFQGLSLGSVLVLIGLGLAVTFGLMGVINMAHGELMMIGAFATYQMQLFFMGLIAKGHLSASAYDWYYIIALPVSFLTAAAVGMLMEILVVRHLYRRPVESLLATWGLGLILIQLVRMYYGDNVGVNAPSWARGGVEVMQDVIVPYGRLFIVFVCAACIGLIYFLMNKTPLGLQMRATMQNREMANSLGVNTVWVDRITFSFGAGLAGIAGCAWTLIGGVTPDMGQKNFIVDAFLVVVTGGVGELAGVICSGFGIGLISKWIEPLTINDFVVGAIWAKVLLLVMIMAFIQFKPSGLFAPKGRLSDV